MPFLEPDKQPIIGPIAQLAGRSGSIDIFVVLVPAPHHAVEALYLFEGSLIKGLAAGHRFEGVFEAVNTLLAWRDP
jgi:hypothetical protein